MTALHPKELHKFGSLYKHPKAIKPFSASKLLMLGKNYKFNNQPKAIKELVDCLLESKIPTCPFPCSGMSATFTLMEHNWRATSILMRSRMGPELIN
jgi:hypothetical protein